MKLNYLHVDVFTSAPLSGNGLIVFYDCPPNLSDKTLLSITQEMRQFESIFLEKITENKYAARIFTMEEELDFAGHPILGAAAALYHIYKPYNIPVQWRIQVKQREIIANVNLNGSNYCATMDQGKPEFIHIATTQECKNVLSALNLKKDYLYPKLPLEVISTGLPHLIVPLARGIEQAKVLNNTFESLLQSMGAKFVYVLDIPNQEGRTWDNAGIFEDIATGSAAGTAGAYLYKHKLINKNEVVINQGRFVNRPSQMKVTIVNEKNHLSSIMVSGEVAIFAHGEIFFDD